MSNSLHVLVVDDSAVVRQTIQGVLSTQPDITTSSASDPFIAMEKMKRQRPEVIILDLEMPRMDGLTFLRKLMSEDPLPVIVCSGYVGNASAQAMRALEAGAVDLIAKPNLGVRSFLNDSALMLIDAVRAAAAYRVNRRRPAVSSATEGLARPRPIISSGSGTARVIAIGASTGGTEAIRAVLEPLPSSTCGMVIVQHMPAPFTRSFAARLNEITALEVKEAEQGDEVRGGRVLIAPGDKHMLLASNGSRCYVDVVDGPLISRHRPSVDALFHSVAATGQEAVGVILTGMGADGAAGLLELKQSGATTIAQDEATCAIFGMPREAIRKGAVSEVLALADIPQALIRLGSR